MALVSDKISSEIRVLTFDFDPDSANATDVSFEDMQDWSKLMIIFFRTVGTGNLDTFKILANSASDGSDTDVTIKTHAVASEPNAVGDSIFLELIDDEIAQEGNDASPKQTDLRFVSANLEFATSTDEGVVVYIFSGAKRAAAGRTVQKIA